MLQKEGERAEDGRLVHRHEACLEVGERQGAVGFHEGTQHQQAQCRGAHAAPLEEMFELIHDANVLKNGIIFLL